MILLLQAADSALWGPARFAAALALLPGPMQSEILELRRQQDRQARLLGRLLLRAGLERLGLPEHAHLNGWTRTTTGRPCLTNCRADWNISHASGLVLCALTLAGRVGVDVERRGGRDISELRGAFGAAEWADIQASPQPERTLLRLWTAKEAALKADGRGLTLEPNTLDARRGVITLGGTTWCVSHPELGLGWVCALATADPQPRILRQTVDVGALLGWACA